MSKNGPEVSGPLYFWLFVFFQVSEIQYIRYNVVKVYVVDLYLT